jgi:hypothetical protein
VLSGAGKGALIGGGTSALMGRDPIEGALMGAATGGIGAGAGSTAAQLGAGRIGAGIAGGAAGSATGALARGKDPGQAALMGGLTGGITGGLNSQVKGLGTALAPATKFGVSSLLNGQPPEPQMRRMQYGPQQFRSPYESQTQSPYSYAGGMAFNRPYRVAPLLEAGTISAPGSSLLNNLGRTRFLASGGVTGQKVGNTETNLAQQPTTAKGVLQGNINYELIDKLYSPEIKQYAEGGEVEEHNPQFFSEGGLNSLENTYVKGDGDGTSDSVPAMLANGEFVIPADVVSSLGNGSNDSGSQVLSEFLATIRSHKQKHDAKQLPPDSKGPLAYLTDAKRKTKV